MKIFGKIVTAVAFVAMSLSGVAPAGAQDALKPPVIALVNYSQILQESKAGKSVNDQVVKQREAYLAEIKKMQASLEKEAKELEQQQGVLAQDVLETRIVEFRRKQREAKQSENGYRRALDQMQVKGLSIIEETLNDILEDIAKKRGIDIVMKAGTPNSEIVKARKELFITADVIKALDAKLPSVKIPPVAQ